MSTSSVPIITTTNVKTETHVPEAPHSYLSETFSSVIGGKLVTSPLTVGVLNPYDRQVIAKIPEATLEQVEEVVSAARAAFREWKMESWDSRRDTLEKVAEILDDEEFANRLAKMMVDEMGKPITVARKELQACSSWIRESIAMSLEEPVVVLDQEQTKIFSYYVPIGVVAANTTWNFSFLLVIQKLVPALLAGNVLILRPSPLAPLAVLTFCAKVQEVLPPGVLSALTGEKEVARLATHPGVDKTVFTGSPETGKKVVESAADPLKRVALRINGNEPYVVLPDANPARVASAIVQDVLMNYDQYSRRVYVHEAIYDQFLGSLVNEVMGIVVGNPHDASTRLGPVCNHKQYDVICELLNDCKNAQLDFAIGGEVDAYATGCFIPFTVINNPPDDSKVVRSGTYGPVIPVMKWSDEMEVIRRINDTRCGTGASVWGKREASLQNIARHLEAGVVWINKPKNPIPLQPQGVYKESGIGIEGGIEGLKEWCNIQTYAVDKVVQV